MFLLHNIISISQQAPNFDDFCFFWKQVSRASVFPPQLGDEYEWGDDINDDDDDDDDRDDGVVGIGWLDSIIRGGVPRGFASSSASSDAAANSALLGGVGGGPVAPPTASADAFASAQASALASLLVRLYACAYEYVCVYA